MPRLGHKKSRNGCRQCKARHVKCDEQKPCSNCARHGAQCSLVTWSLNHAPSLSIKRESSVASRLSQVEHSIPERMKKSTGATTTSLPIDYVLNPTPTPTSASSENSSPYSQSNTYPFLAKFAHKTALIQSNYWVRDMELMHHWTIETYHSMAMQEEIRIFWRNEAPKQAVKHIFLLHEILAISAFHKAYLQPDQRQELYALGIHHQDFAIREMSKVLPRLDAGSAGAMFATSAVISLTTFASIGLKIRQPTSTNQVQIQDLLDIFALQKGMYSILSQNQAHVLDGPFAVLLSNSETERGEPELPILFSILDQIPTITAFLESQPLSPATRTEIKGALSSLRTCLEFANAPGASTRELRFIFFWPNFLNQTFFNMLRRKEPSALVILAYYAVALRVDTRFYWFLEGWAEGIVRSIIEAVEPEWQPILQWPWNTVIAIGAQHAHSNELDQHVDHRPLQVQSAF